MIGELAKREGIFGPLFARDSSCQQLVLLLQPQSQGGVGIGQRSEVVNPAPNLFAPPSTWVGSERIIRVRFCRLVVAGFACASRIGHWKVLLVSTSPAL